MGGGAILPDRKDLLQNRGFADRHRHLRSFAHRAALRSQGLLKVALGEDGLILEDLKGVGGRDPAVADHDGALAQIDHHVHEALLLSGGVPSPPIKKP